MAQNTNEPPPCPVNGSFQDYLQIHSEFAAYPAKRQYCDFCGRECDNGSYCFRGVFGCEQHAIVARLEATKISRWRSEK